MPPSSEHELALTLYQAFLRSNDAMLFCDPKGTIRDVNDAFTRHYGWKREEVVGQNPRLLRSQYTTTDTYREMWSRIMDPKVGFWRGELVNLAPDHSLPIDLYWHCWNLDSAVLDALTEALTSTAAASLIAPRALGVAARPMQQRRPTRLAPELIAEPA